MLRFLLNNPRWCRATEHVRMLDAGRQRVAYSSPLTSNCFDSVVSTKTQLLQHGNTFGLSFMATTKGFMMTTNDVLETSCIDYGTRRQEALDHGQKLTLEEIYELPGTREIQLPSIAYWIALSSNELLVAVAYADAVALYEVAHILEAVNPAPFHTFSKLQAQEIAWCTDPESDRVAVLTLEKNVVVCTLDGAKDVIDIQTDVSSISWSPSGKQIALGLVDSTIAIYEWNSLRIARSIGKPKCCADANFEVHYVNWAEEDLILAGYQKYDEENEETSALACIFEHGECMELDEVVGFFDVANRRHQYFSAFLPDWRMFFIGCSLSADIELLVSDPESGEWELWKPLEKYQARLPMNVEDGESFPMGFALNLNSTSPVPVDEDAYPPVPIISCSNTEGLLVNFAFVDTTVSEVDFVKSPLPFEKKVTRIAAAEDEPKALENAATGEFQLTSNTVSPDNTTSLKHTISHEYGQNDENEFVESDGESSDEEEERKEEEDKARITFRTIVSDGSDFILSEQFPKLIKAMGSTYAEEEHAKTLENLEKDGKVYEADFVSWYVDWIFGDDDSDSDDNADTPASSATEPAEMKSKEDIAAAFLRLSAKEGSWKCGVCMVSNNPEAIKCSACEAPNPAAPKSVVPVTAASAPTSAGSIGSGGFSFPVSTEKTSKPSSLSFGASPGATTVCATKSSEISSCDTAPTSGFSFPSSSTTSEMSFRFLPTTKPATGVSFGSPDEVSFGGGNFGGGSDDAVSASKGAPAVDPSVEKSKPSSPLKTMSHEYGQNDRNEFAASEEDESDDEEERKEEEANARNAFRSITLDGTDYINVEQLPKPFKALGLTYSKEEQASTLESLEKDGKIYEVDFISWYVDWIFDNSDSDEEDGALLSPKNAISHEYGQNDENEFVESDGESSDEEEERKEEEDKARTTFRTIASDGSDFILSEQFSKLIKAMGSTYAEEEHAKTLENLEKDGKVYEADFVSWYVDWIFGDDDSDSDDNADTPASSATEPAEMKSKEDIAAAFLRLSAKEGSWKCGVCMVSNNPEAIKCSACEAPNPAAPKSVVPVTAASAPTSAGSIGSGGFSFPVSTEETSKPSSLSFGASPGATTVCATKSSEISSCDTAPTSGFSFPSRSTTSETGTTGLAFGSSTVSASIAGSSAYPPDTTSKPKLPTFGATSKSGYPPDTTSKPKLPTFGAASKSGYPPDTTSKPKLPTFCAASKSGYPPDTTSKPKLPTFGATSKSGYPPDTTSKPKLPTFGAATKSGYPPDTTSKPKLPTFGAASKSGYPPDTTSKPKLPTFGAASKSGYPPDTTSKPKPSGKTTSSSSFVSGNNFFQLEAGLSASTNSFGQGDNSSTVTATNPKSLFGSVSGNDGATDTTSSRFGVVSKPASEGAFSFGSTSANGLKDNIWKTNTARPSFTFDTLSSTLDKTEESEGDLPTKRTLNFGDSNAYEAKTNEIPTAKVKTLPICAPAKPSKSIPSSQMEGQLWKLIVEFNKSLQRVNESSKSILSKDPAFSKNILAKTDNLRAQLSHLCDEVNNLDESRDKIEKDVLFVIGSDGDVHEQLEYGREILNSFNDEVLKRTLEAQPLDQRSKETWESLKSKLNEVEKCCLELDSHLSSSPIGGTGAVSSAHLFRVLKQTYDTSKMQYNKVCMLAENLERLSLRGDRKHQANGVGGVTAVESEFHPIATKADMIEMIVETEQRSQDVRRNFLSLCNNVVTPRDVFSTPRRKLAPPSPSNSSTSPLRVKACSKLMPKMQLSVASPMSSAKQSSRSVSFKTTPVKSGSKLFSLAEAMAPKEKPAKFVQTPQPARPSVGVGKAPQRPSLGTPTTEAKSALATSSTEALFSVPSFPKPSKETESMFAPASAKTDDTKTVSTTSTFSGIGNNSPTVKLKLKADDRQTPAFSLGGKETPASTHTFSFGSKDAKSTIGSVTPDYKALLEKFYKVHNPSKTSGDVIEKALTTYKGREEDLFTRLFSMYVPDSMPDAVKKYLNGGPVPSKSESVAATAKSSTPVATAKSPFGGSATAQLSPFGTPSSAFSLGPAANKSSSGFGSTAVMSSSTLSSVTTPPFGKSAVDYHQKLVEFYQKHNPDKLSSVDATLQKYKGNEEKLFQSLAVKYKVTDANGGVPNLLASPAVPPAKPNAGTSPFGKTGAFSASASSVGFGAVKPSPAASPFGTAQTPAAIPFGATSQTSSGFGSAGGSGFGSGFQSTSATPPAFGAPTSFGETTTSGFGAAGRANYREKLTAFYQQYNPAKLSSVDATLEKYRGREDHLFGMLEQKYVKKTSMASTSGGFGIPSPSTFGGGGFGAPSGLGIASAVPAFGSASTLGGTTQPAFGGTTGSGFGMASRMGGGFASAAPAASSGGATGSGFGAFGAQTSTFGGAAQQSGGFGAAAANSGGFGSSFGGNTTTSSFGPSAAFNSSSFTQMR
ncbi:hypothetical protein KXD40_003014 [Peronospora effusa]|nr:hypothetical protein KXD40_003014 [Peronospora effusa]